MTTVNQCVDCSGSFEVSEALWLFCGTCQKKRSDDTSLEIERMLSRHENDPDLAELKTEVKATRRKLLGDVYAAL